MLAKIKAHRETRRVIAECLKEHDVSLSEWLLLGSLYSCKKLTMGEIARYLDIKLPLVSRYVKELSERGLVSAIKDNKDKRTKYVTITESGLDLVTTTEPEVKRALKVWLKDIPREHIDIYINTTLLLGK